jgi:hypothetical protein
VLSEYGMLGPGVHKKGNDILDTYTNMYTLYIYIPYYMYVCTYI